MSQDPIEGCFSLNKITSIFSLSIKVFVFCAFGALIECYEDKNKAPCKLKFSCVMCMHVCVIERVFFSNGDQTHALLKKEIEQNRTGAVFKTDELIITQFY